MAGTERSPHQELPFVHYGLIHYILFEIVAQDQREGGKPISRSYLVLFVYKKK